MSLQILRNLLRGIICRGEEDDEGFYGRNSARCSTGSISRYDAGCYSRAEDARAQIRSPLLPEKSPPGPWHVSSSSSLLAVKLLPAVNPGDPYSSYYYPRRAQPLSPPPLSKVTPSPAPSANKCGKDQPGSNPPQAPPKAFPSSSLPSDPPTARALTLPSGNTEQQGASVDPRASPLKLSFPSASPLQPKLAPPKASPSSSLPANPPTARVLTLPSGNTKQQGASVDTRASPSKLSLPSASTLQPKVALPKASPSSSSLPSDSTSARVLALPAGNTKQQSASVDPCASSSKLSLPSASPLQPKVASPKATPSLPSNSTSGRVLALPAGNTKQQRTPVDPRASSPKLSLPSAPPLQPKVFSSLSFSTQTPESGSRSPEIFTVRTSQDVPERFNIPGRLLELFKNDVVPPVLLNPLSPGNYAEYLTTLMHAEDYEIEKFTEYKLFGVAMKLQSKGDFFKNKNCREVIEKKETDEYPFVTFRFETFPEKRPYLLSRDFILVRRAGQENSEAYKGEIFRVVKNTVLVEFGCDFHRQHKRTSQYDVNFSYNRVCFKRSHMALSVALDPPLRKILFPDDAPVIDPATWTRKAYQSENCSLMHRLVNLEGLAPFLIQGPVADISGILTATGRVIREAIVQIFRARFGCRILICAPRNRTCDSLMRSLLDVIPQMKLFRANAAFREALDVPDDIMPSCLYEGECFGCPPVDELRAFGVVTSTFMSSFRLQAAGIEASHFTHIFLVDASSVVEPEAIVPLASLVGQETAVVISGSAWDAPRFVRSKVGRMENGLKRSLFRRLMEREPYSSNHPSWVARINCHY